MNNLTIQSFLLIHLIAVFILLLISLVFLIKSGHFRWTSSGFWSWVSFLLYFFLNPLFSVILDKTVLYERNILLSGGVKHGFWVLFLVLLGITLFFIFYIKTRSNTQNWNLRNNKFNIPMLLVSLIFSIFGIYSIISQRSLLVTTSKTKIIEGGRFVGEVSGYEHSGYFFLVIPILLLLLSKTKKYRFFGWLTFVLFIIFTLPHGWSRYGLISMVIAVSIVRVITSKKKKNWPSFLYIPLILIFTVVLQLRGHTQWNLNELGSEVISLSTKSFSNIGQAIGSGEVSMLSTLYLESYLTDNYIGYNYGIPLVNYMTTSWIPSKVFPNKYFMIDWLHSMRSPISYYYERLLFGAKSTLFGSFYNIGGVIGVILLSSLMGYLSKKLDGMITQKSPMLIQAIGISWLSIFWMAWGSSDTWVLMNLGILGLPGFVMWFFAPKKASTKLMNK